MARIKNTTLYSVDSLVTENDILIGTDGDNSSRTKNYKVSDLLAFFQNNNPTDYVLPTASDTVLGGIKVDGLTLSIDIDGVLSVVDTYQPSGLEEVTENSVTGWRFIGEIAGDNINRYFIGNKAIDGMQFRGNAIGLPDAPGLPYGTNSQDGIHFGVDNKDNAQYNTTILGALNQTNAFGFATMIGGYNNAGYGYGDTLIGSYNTTTPNNVNSFLTAIGHNVTMSGSRGGVGLGLAITNNSNGAVMVGTSNTIWSGASNAGDRPMFQVGIGNTTTPAGRWLSSLRQDGFTVKKDGTVLGDSLTVALIDAETTGKVLTTREWIEAQGFGGATTTPTLDLVTTEGNLSSSNIIIDPLSSTSRTLGENLTVRASATGTGFQAGAFFDVSRVPSANSVSSATYGIFSRAISDSTFADNGVVGAYLSGDYIGSGGAGYVYGSLTEARVLGSGNTNFLIGDSIRAKSEGTATNTIGSMRGASFISQLNNINSTVTSLQGFHASVSLDGGTATNSQVALLDFDYTGGNITGDFAYIQIQADGYNYSTFVGGDARAINSDSLLPSRFAGSIESTGYFISDSGFVHKIATTALTANKTALLQDADGTLAYLEDIALHGLQEVTDVNAVTTTRSSFTGGLDVGSATNPFGAVLNVNAGVDTTTNSNYVVYNAINKTNTVNSSNFLYGISNLIEQDGSGNWGQVRGIFNRARIDGTGLPTEVLGSYNEVSYRYKGTGSVPLLSAQENYVYITEQSVTNTVQNAFGARSQVVHQSAGTTSNFVAGHLADVSISAGTINAFNGLNITVSQTGGTIVGGSYVYLGTGINLTQAQANGVRAIDSRIDLPSVFVGTVKAKEFIKTVGTNDDILLADGTTTSLSALIPLKAEVSLTSAQIKTLFSSPIELVPAPGVGKRVVIKHASVQYTYVSEVFEFTSIVVGDFFSGFSNNANSFSYGTPGDGISFTFKDNENVVVTTANDSTTGDGSMTVRVEYEIIDL